ncbi:uncharacterized protein LOC135709122 [Ochlerotatus camptorhynchus]|uniref:uncharacterized protein LOC135709122 n=1 Tax=Ochlerotatus camptorhynchus TaxID=644619 RepID=UPI0031D64911
MSTSAIFIASREPGSPRTDATLSACSSIESLVTVDELEPGPVRELPRQSADVSVASVGGDSVNDVAVNQQVMRLQKCSAAGLSPVSEIAFNLKDTSLDTPKTGRAVVGGGRERSLGKAISSDFKSMLEAGESNGQPGQERLPSGHQASGGDNDEGDDNQDNDDYDDPDKRYVPSSPDRAVTTTSPGQLK